MSTTWRWGVLLDERSADMLDEAQRLYGGHITATQGCYNAGGVSQSAGTHDGGGAVDLSASGLSKPQSDQLVLAMRRVGWAAWLRTPAQGDWPYHVHGIAGACPDLSTGARDQWSDYLAGRNGLANNGPDDGPRNFDHVGITWEQYQNKAATEAQLLEGVLDMAANTVVMFVHGNTWHEADLIAGTYRGFSEAQDFKDRKHVLSKAGVPFMIWNDGDPVGNPDAFGKKV